MRTKLHLKAIALFTEHSYVQHPWLTIEDETGAIWRMLESFTKDIEYYMKQNNQQNGNLAEYLRIREGIQNWDCDEKFKSIKEFALNQIDISMDKSDYYEKELKKCGKPTREGFLKVKDEYIKKMIDHAQWDVDYHTKELESAIRRRDENLAFYKEFKESIANL